MRNTRFVSIVLTPVALALASDPDPSFGQATSAAPATDTRQQPDINQLFKQWLTHGSDLTSISHMQGPSAEIFQRGGQATSIPSEGQPGAEYFQNGSQAISITARGQANAGSDYFMNGSQVTSIGAPGRPGSEFFHNGAQATSIPAPGQPGAEFFQNGAQATSIPAPGQPGAEFFQNGSQAMSLNRGQKSAVAPPPLPTEQEEAGEPAPPPTEPPTPATDGSEAQQPTDEQPEQAAPEEPQPAPPSESETEAAPAAPPTGAAIDDKEPLAALQAQPPTNERKPEKRKKTKADRQPQGANTLSQFTHKLDTGLDAIASGIVGYISILAASTALLATLWRAQKNARKP